MAIQNNNFLGSRQLLAGLVAGALAAQVMSSSAQIVTLTDNNSVAQINTGSQAGMFNWTVDGVNQLAQQWFWFRVGGVGSEASINTISGSTITQPNTKSANVSYANAAYGVSVNYTLNGQAPGSGLSGMGELVRISNFTAAPLDFHFFQYSDFDLGGTPGGQSVVLSKNSFTGLWNTADHFAPGVALSETVATPGANHAEAGLFPNTLNKLNNGVADTLNDVAGAGPGNVTWAFEWDLTIAPGSSADINKALSLTITQVPEPTSVALISLGLLAFGIKRRKN